MLLKDYFIIYRLRKSPKVSRVNLLQNLTRKATKMTTPSGTSARSEKRRTKISSTEYIGSGSSPDPEKGPAIRDSRR